jgi:RNA recognition motif-containing protein
MHNIIVEGLPPSCSSEDLYELFQTYGEVLSVTVVCGPHPDDECRASVGMGSQAQADRAMTSLNGIMFQGHDIHMTAAGRILCYR